MTTLLDCATTPLLCGADTSLFGATTLLLVYDTYITWADTSLFSAITLLLVLRHFYYVGRHVSIQCDSTPALCYDTSITWAGMSLFSIVPYLRVHIVLSSSHSLLPVYADIYLYVVYSNNMTYANNYMIRI